MWSLATTSLNQTQINVKWLHQVRPLHSRYQQFRQWLPHDSFRQLCHLVTVYLELYIQDSRSIRFRADFQHAWLAKENHSIKNLAHLRIEFCPHRLNENKLKVGIIISNSNQERQSELLDGLVDSDSQRNNSLLIFIADSLGTKDNRVVKPTTQEHWHRIFDLATLTRIDVLNSKYLALSDLYHRQQVSLPYLGWWF